MRMLPNHLLISCLLCALLCACGSQLKVAKVDEKTGLLKSDTGPIARALIVVWTRLPLAEYKEIAFFSNGGEYGVDQLKAIGFFNQVLNYDDLRRVVVANNLQAKVPSLSEPADLSRLYGAYKPFLWIHFRRVEKGGAARLQLIATNPANLEDVFVAEVPIDFLWTGVSDQTTRYPLFNALIEWINQNQ